MGQVEGRISVTEDRGDKLEYSESDNDKIIKIETRHVHSIRHY